MKNSNVSIGIGVAVVIIIVAAVMLLSGTKNNAPGSSGAGNQTTSGLHAQAPLFTKLYVGQSAYFSSSQSSFAFRLAGISKTGNGTYVMLNMSGANYTNELLVGQNQYVTFGSGRAPYLLVGQISGSGNDSQDWVMVNFTTGSLPEGFSAAPNNGRNPNANYNSSAMQGVGNSTEEELLNMPANLPACGANDTFFTVPDISLSNLTNIMPLGHVYPSGHVFPINHLYFYMKLYAGNRTSIVTNVVAPGNITVYRIEQWNVTDPNGKVLWTEYQLEFAPCAHVAGFFYHLSSLSDKLLSNVTRPFAYCSNATAGTETWQDCDKYVNIKMKAGELIGTGGGKLSQSVDWGLYDFRATPMVFANDSRFIGVAQDYSRYVVCPLDYFIPSVRSSLYVLLGGTAVNGKLDSFTKRTAQPVCGSSDQDVPGTAQGAWFVGGAPMKGLFVEDPNLALVPDNVNTSMQLFSVGTSMSASGLSTGVYYFAPSASGSVNRNFSSISSDGNVYCYQTTEETFADTQDKPTIIMQLVTPTQLRIERINASGCGSGPWSFTPAATYFYR